MMEIDIIKYYLFTTSESRLISIIANPDFSVENEMIKNKLSLQYKEDKTIGIDDILNTVVKEAGTIQGSTSCFS